MIKLNQTASQYLQIITAQNGVVVDVSYSDKTTSDFAGDSQVTAITAAGTNTVCATPAVGAVRYIDFIAVTNTFAGNHTITLQKNSGGTAYPIVKDLVLSVGDRLEYTHACGARVVDSTGAIHTVVATPQVVIAAGKTITVSNSLTLAGTDGTTLTGPSASGTLAIDGPTFSAYRSTTQNVTTATWTKALCDTEEFDTASAYDNVTNYRFTPLIAGYYQVSGIIGFAAASGLTRVHSAIYKNGTIHRRGDDCAPSLATAGGASVSALIFLNGTTDYVELWGNCTGTDPSFFGTISQTNFQAVLVRSA